MQRAKSKTAAKAVLCVSCWCFLADVVRKSQFRGLCSLSGAIQGVAVQSVRVVFWFIYICYFVWLLLVFVVVVVLFCACFVFVI